MVVTFKVSLAGTAPQELTDSLSYISYAKTISIWIFSKNAKYVLYLFNRRQEIIQKLCSEFSSWSQGTAPSWSPQPLATLS